jgi:hypothetical protein
MSSFQREGTGRLIRRLVVLTVVAVSVLLLSAGSAGASDACFDGIGAGSQSGYGVATGCFDGLTGGDRSGSIVYSQAGGAPYSIVTTFDVNTRGRSFPGEGLVAWPFEPVKDVIVDTPVGLVGNPTVLSQCTAAQLGQYGATGPTACPSSSQMGVIHLDLTGSPGGTLPLFNMVAPYGASARFGFNALGVPVFLDARLRYGSDYGISVDSHNISEGLPFIGARVTFWGVPADPSHDPERACPGQIVATEGGPSCSAGVPPARFLRLSTSCTSPGEGLPWSLHTDSWWNPGMFDSVGDPVLSDPNWKSVSFTSHEPPGRESQPNPENWGAPVGVEGCQLVPVKGQIVSQATSQNAETPTGLNVTVSIPNPGLENPVGIASSDMKKVVVSLPEGVTINPSQGDGLGACSPAQYASTDLASSPGTGCPETSKIGTVTVHTQLLSESLEGDVFVAQPYENPFPEPGHPGGSLLALYVVIKNQQRGVMIKLAGKIEPNPKTGQLTSTFDDIPQLPFESFELHFREGVRAPLATPNACGTYTTTAQFTPYSDPSHTISGESTFQIIHGVGGGPCPSGGVPPFRPQVLSGTQSNAAGSYSPFYLRLIRNDGEQELTKFTTVLPPGLTGNLTGIPFCSDAAIEAARVATGTHELNEPACPAASEIGHTSVGAGVGSVLVQAPGKVYLAGPYHGSALSIVSITSATVGPFDLGTVVIRFALRINPLTAQVEVDSTGSDPIPHIIRGIVVHVRDIRVYMDRSKFIVNPTSCNTMSIANTITGAGADFTNPADAFPVTVTSPFQAADCSNLAFKPVFKVSTSGKTSRSSGASLSVKLAYPNAPFGTQANIRSVKVDLPKQLPSRLTTLQKACPDGTFNTDPAQCPAASRVGRATAVTPILPVPLEGPAYFVSHGGAKFPELIVVLQGYGFTIDLHGETFISKAGITSSTFRTVPDQPVTSFQLTLPQGKYSALAANGNLCNSKLTMPTAFTAQNGTVIHQTTKITVTQCAKHRARKAKKARAPRR